MRLSFLPAIFISAVTLFGGYSSSAQNRTNQATQPAGKWQKITSPTSHFSIEMPGVPTVQPRAKNPDPYWTLVDRGTGNVYSVTSSPVHDVTPTAAGEILQKQSADMTKAFSAKVLSQKHLSMAGYPGIEMRFQTPDGKVWRALVYVLKSHQYTLMANGDAKSINTPNVEKFFKSFAISNR